MMEPGLYKTAGGTVVNILSQHVFKVTVGSEGCDDCDDVDVNYLTHEFRWYCGRCGGGTTPLERMDNNDSLGNSR